MKSASLCRLNSSCTFPEAVVGIGTYRVPRIDRSLVQLVKVQEGIPVQTADPSDPAAQKQHHLLLPLRQAVIRLLLLLHPRRLATAGPGRVEVLLEPPRLGQ